MRQPRQAAFRHSWMDAVDVVAAALVADGGLSEQSFDKLVELMRRFARFATSGHGVGELGAITEEVAAGFVAASWGGEGPSVSTQHLRRSAVRLLFRVARQLELVEGDPTLDLELPPRSGSKLRPLTDDEVAVCRAAAVHSLDATRLPSAWALTEATARTSEISAVTVAEVDLDGGRVLLPGATKVEARSAELTEWGGAQLARRLAVLDGDPGTPVVYEGDGSATSRQASACVAVSVTLARAGLGDERGVKPASVPAWVGTKVFEATGRIEVVAERLGMRSPDRAAAFIGLDWRAAGVG